MQPTTPITDVSQSTVDYLKQHVLYDVGIVVIIVIWELLLIYCHIYSIEFQLIAPALILKTSSCSNLLWQTISPTQRKVH